MKYPLFAFAFSLIACLLAASLHADELRFARHYSDHMVLQRDKPTTLKGFAAPQAKVTVTFGDQSKEVVAADDGTWSVQLDAMSADAEGREVKATVDGADDVILKDVVVGDVFLYGRQTSIDVSLGGSDAGQKAADSFKPNGNFRAIRIQTVATHQPLSELDESATAGWATVDSKVAKEMSAAAFYFGRDLASEVEVPVGIIDLNMGAYFGIGWMSQEAIQAAVKSLKEPKELTWLNEWMLERAADRDSGAAQKKLDEYYENQLARAGGKETPIKPSLGLHPKENPMYPSGGFNAVINPLKGLALRGVVLQLGADYPYIPYRRLAAEGTAQVKPELDQAWFQNYMVMKIGYRQTENTLPLVPRNWRRALGDRRLPIALVSPPSSDLYAYAEHNREMRELHRRMAEKDRAMWQIVPSMGNAAFSGQPADELVLAERCRTWALKDIYKQEEVVSSGPTFDRFEASLGNATVHFKPGTAEGLSAEEEVLSNFEVAAPGGEFMPAKAWVEDSTIKLHSPDVGQIAYVRFNWNTDPNPGLTNAANLPAAPFNTDDRWVFGWYYPESESVGDLPEEYSTTADQWGDSDVAIINGEIEFVVTGDSEKTPRRPGPIGAFTAPFGPNIYVISIDPGTPAVGKLMPGDYIFGVNGEKFQDDGDVPFLQLSEAITYSESDAGQGKLVLMVRRGKEIMDVELDLGVMGTYSPTSPFYCEKTNNIIEKAKQWSSNQFRPESGPATNPTGMLDTDLWFLLATGDPEVQGLVRRAVYQKMEKMKLEEPSPYKPMHNWSIGYAAILFGEYYHATGDPNVLPYLKNLSDWAAVTQIKEAGDEPVPWEVAQRDEHIGGYRQRYNPEGADRWKSGYGLMPPAGTACVSGMIYAKEAGLEVDEKALADGIRHFRFQRAEHGYVEYLYSNLRKETLPELRPEVEARGGLSSLNGKLGQAAAMFRLLDDHQPVEICSRICVYSYNNTRYGHGGMFFNNMWTGIGAHAAGDPGFKHFMQGNRWWRELFRRHDGAFNQVGRGGVGVGYGVPYVAPRKRMRILGAPKSAFGTIAADYLKPALEAHRERDYELCEKLLVELPDTMAIPAEDRPTYDHFLESVRILRQSIDHDLEYTQAQIASGNYDYAAMEIDQLKGVVAEDDPRLATIIEDMESVEAKDALRKLPGQRKQEEADRQAELMEALPEKKDETWVGLTPDLREAKSDDESTKWKMKLVEDRVQAPEGWDDVDFDDSSWDDAELPISWAMYHTALFRGTFTVDEPAKFDKLRFRGGFFQQGNVMIYINGELVAKVDNIGRGVGMSESELTDYATDLLRKGENTVAVTTRHKRRWGPLRGEYTQAAGFTFVLDARVKE